MLIDLVTDKPKEECGIFGIYATQDDVAYNTYLGLFALQHRGQESAGIVLSDGKNVEIKRGMGLVTEVFRDGMPALENARMAIGHVRYSTTGANLPINVQPLKVSFAGGNLSLSHNGNLTNAKSLREKLAAEGAVFQTSVDTEIIITLIARSRANTIEEKIAEAMRELSGAFSVLVMTDEKLFAVRDSFGYRPLCIGQMEDGAYVVSSESCAFEAVGAEFVRDVLPGEVIVIDNDTTQFTSYFFKKVAKKLAHCVFEYIYFARVDSVIDQQGVYDSRVAMGRQLARENKHIQADVVISVPDSGTPAAIGYSLESGIPFMEGLIKNRYIGRTFIQPNQKQRLNSVKMKLSVVKSLVKGKRVVMVDDSIVRGTTSGKIVKLLKDAGAIEVHMCVSSPPVTDPCYYGIDTSVRKELIATTHTEDQIRDYIGADSLRYISMEGLQDCFTGISPKNMCYACFNGDYPEASDCNDKEVFE